MGEPQWSGRRDINGKTMTAHVHIADKPWCGAGIYSYDGNGHLFTVVIDTEEYGLMEQADADFIAHSRDDIEYLLSLPSGWRV
jgi:hypothetical protein